MTDNDSKVGASTGTRRRSILKTGAGVLTLGGLAGCTGDGGGSNGGGGGDGGTTIGGNGGGTTDAIVPGERDFSGTSITWYDHKSASLQGVKLAAKKWEEQTGGKVEFTGASPNDILTKEKTLLNSKSSKMDIVGAEYGVVPQYAAGGHIVDLTPYIDRLHDGWQQDDFVDAVWDIHGKNRYKDGHWGISTKFGLFIMMWNQKYFEEAGFDPEKAPETLDDLEQYAEQLDTEDYAGFDTVWLRQQGATRNWELHYSKLTGQTIFDQNGYPTFWMDKHKSNAIEEIKRWERITQHSAKDYVGRGFSGTTSVLSSGQAAMVYQWAPFLNNLVDNEDAAIAGNVGWGLTPKGSKNHNQMLGGWTACLSEYSKNKEAAFDFIAFATNPENSLEGAQKKGMAMPRNSVLSDDKVIESKPWTPTVQEGLKNAFPHPKTLGFQEFDRKFSEMMQQAISGKQVQYESRLKSLARLGWDINDKNLLNPSKTGERP